MQSSKTFPRPCQTVRPTMCRENPASDLTISQFLKYLEVLKQGESVLREEVDKDEAFVALLHQRRPSQPKDIESRRRSSCVSDVGLIAKNYQDISTLSSGDRSDSAGRVVPSRLSVSSAYLKTNTVRPRHREESVLRTPNKTKQHGMKTEAVRPRLFEERAGLQPEYPVCFSADEREASTSSISVLTASPCSRRQPFLTVSNSDGNFATFQNGVALPVITFSADNSAYYSRRRSCALDRQSSRLSYQAGKDTGNTHCRSRFYSDNTPGNYYRQTRFSNGSPIRNTESQRKAHSTNTKGSVIFKEFVLPCPHECAICELDESPRPIRLYYSHPSTGVKNSRRGNRSTSDGNGMPIWPSSRKKEIKGLVYNRLSHSFHPPLPRKSMM